MAVRGPADAAILVFGGLNVLGTRTDLTLEAMRDTEETTPLGVQNKTFGDVGQTSWRLAQNGFYDDAAGSSNAQLLGQIGLPTVGVVAVSGNLAGRPFTGLAGALENQYHRSVTRGQLHKANGTYNVVGLVEDGGTILFPLAAQAGASINSTAFDNGAATAHGGAGYLELVALALGGSTSLQVKIQHSVDNVTYADLVTFTANTAAPAGQRIALAATAAVNRWVRAQISYIGAGAGQSATLMAGFYRNL